MTGPLALYRQRVDRGELTADAAQVRAVEALERLYRDLLRATPPSGWRGQVAKLAGKRRQPVRGLYLWGGVGRGKTFLMDLFFNALPFQEKRRQHFHRFMAAVHERLKQHRNVENPLELVAAEIANETRIICFDEFAVTDIADAMLLGNLFAGLVRARRDAGRHLQHRAGPALRRRPAAAALPADDRAPQGAHARSCTSTAAPTTACVRSSAPTSIRRRRASWPINVSPSSSKPSRRTKATTAARSSCFGRPIPYRRAADGVIWFDFESICDGPRSQDDYIEISRLYQTVLVSNVPRFDATLENQARRFIALVDEFYDRRVKLILSAAAPATELYRGERLKHDFLRTQSRLQEMQSHDYLAEAHRT